MSKFELLCSVTCIEDVDNTMQIKACSKNDIGDLIEVSTQSYAEHYSYLWQDGGKDYVESNFNYKKFHEEMLDPNCAFFSIRNELKPVGLIKLNIDSAIDKFTAAFALELERIYLIKEASGRGFGKGAMTFVVNFAKAKNKKIVWLKAMDSSPAVEFYKKSGFIITGETNLNYPQITAGFQRMLFMQLTL